MVHLKLLGGASIEGSGGPISGPAAQRHRLALLGLLAAAHPRAVPRERLMACLWPERDDSSARNLLNQAVHATRKALGKGTVLSRNDELLLEATAVECDLVSFRSAVEEEDWDRALEAYAGCFLDGFYLPGSKVFEEWLATERKQITRTYRDTLERYAAAAAEPTEQARRWRLVAAQDPPSARVALRLMEALEKAGDRAGALRAAESHAEWLWKEFGAEPNPEVTALAERIRHEPRAGSPVWNGPVRSTAPRIGRSGRAREDGRAESHARDQPTKVLPKRLLASRPSALSAVIILGVLGLLAGLWAAVQVVEVLSGRWVLPIGLQRGIAAALVVAFFVALSLVSYHREQGRREVTWVEILLLALLLGIGGGIIGVAGGTPPVVEVADPTLSGAEPDTADSRGAGAVAGRDRVAKGGVIDPLRKLLVDNPAVAVLPLENWGSEGDGAFVEGLHIDILSALQKIGGLTVISRSSVHQYREDPKPVSVVARELSVDAVAEGSMSRAGGRIRVNIRLIDGENDSHLWAEQYDRALTAENIFAIRSEIAHSVARALQAELTPQEEARLAAVPTRSLTAYDWIQIARRRPNRSAEKLDAIRKALETDSLSAAAWSKLAIFHARQAVIGGVPDRVDSALTAANRALELDPLYWEAINTQAVMAAQVGQLSRALEYARRAVELDPSYWAPWLNIGVYAWATGRWIEALESYLRGLRFSPRNINGRVNLGSLYAQLGLHEDAVAILEEAATIAPNTARVHKTLSLVYALHGELDRSRELGEEAVRLDPTLPRAHLWAARIASFQHDIEGALRHARAAHERAPDFEQWMSPALGRVLGYALLEIGDTTAADRHLSQTAARLEERVNGGAEDPLLGGNWRRSRPSAVTRRAPCAGWRKPTTPATAITVESSWIPRSIICTACRSMSA